MNKRGQSALELAVFGSVFLFCLGILVNYGMSYNLQQMHQMQTFRKTLNRAAAADVATNGYNYAQLLVVNDKHLPDPQDAWGIGGFQPFMASYSAAITNELYSEPLYGHTDALPRIEFEINGQKLNCKDDGTCGYTIAGWVEYGLPPNNKVVRKVSDLEDNFNCGTTQESGTSGSDGKYWRYLVIDLTNRYINDDGQLCNASGEVVKVDIDGDGKTENDEIVLSKGMSADVTGDGPEAYSEEYIVDITRVNPHEAEPWEIQSFQCMDYSRGEIDTSIDTENIDINQRPGLQPGYHKVITPNKTLTTTSDETSYGAEDKIDYRESIERTLIKHYPRQSEDDVETITSERAIQQRKPWPSVPR